LGGTYTQIASAGADVSTYGDTGLSAQTEYYYRVRANNGTAYSDYSNESNATTLEQVATPTFDPDGGSFGSSQDVTVTCSTSGATIYYTTNGSTPTESDSTVASGSTVTVASSLTLKAKAFKGGATASTVKSADYTITP
jgi:hypothetical protein